MRLSSIVGSLSTGLVMVLSVYACGGSDSGPATPTVVPDGATVTEDGAVVDPDGNVIPPDTAKPSKVTVTNEQVTVAGAPRAYVLSVPKTYDASRKYPLIIALHGDGQDADGFRIFLGLDDVSGDDAVMAYPDQALDLFTAYDQNPDQLLIDAIITAVKGKLSIDASKVWGFGYSKGAFMVNEIACRKPGVLKAFAAHATGAPQEPQGADGYPQCPGVVGLPVMVTQGDRDPDIGADYAANYWGSVNGCGTNRTSIPPAGCEKLSCPAAKPVIYCRAAGVSHYPIWGGAVQASWDFFKTL